MPYLDDIWYVGEARAEGTHAEFRAWHMLMKYLICIIYSKKMSGTISRETVCPYLDDIWYVGIELRPKVRMLDFGLDTCWSPGTNGVKNFKQYSMTTKLGQKNRWCKFTTMLTFVEVKSHQRSKVVNFVPWLPYLVKRTADTSYELWWPSLGSEVKYSKICSMATTWSEEPLMQVKDDDDLHGGQRSSEVKIISNALRLPNPVRRTTDASLGWWWTSQRSKISRGQNFKQCSMATKLGQKNHWCKFRMVMTFMEVKGQQRSNITNKDLWLPNCQKNHWRKFMIRGGSRYGPIRPQPPPPFWQPNHANSAYFGAISANFPSISTLGPLFLQILGPAPDDDDDDDDDDLHGGQRLTEVKCGQQCSLATKLFCHYVFIVIETDHKNSHDYKKQQQDTVIQYKLNINLTIQSTLRDL